MQHLSGQLIKSMPYRASIWARCMTLLRRQWKREQRRRVWSGLSPVLVAFSPYSTDDVIALFEQALDYSTPDERPSSKRSGEVAEQSGGDAQRAKKLLQQRIILGLSDVQSDTDETNRRQDGNTNGGWQPG